MRRIILVGLTLVAVLVSIVHPASAVTIYGTALLGPNTGSPTSATTLYTIDPNTGTATPIGATGYNQVGAIDFNPSTGILYGTGVNPTTKSVDLITINTATGVATSVGATGVGNFQDISFRSDG